MWYNWFTCKAVGMVADNINSAGQLSIQLVLWSMPQELLDIPTSFIFSLYWASLPLSLCSPELWSFIGPDVTTVYIWSVFQSQDKALENRPVSSEHYVYHLLTDLHTQRRTHTHRFNTGLIVRSDLWVLLLVFGVGIFSHTWVNSCADSYSMLQPQ